MKKAHLKIFGIGLLITLLALSITHFTGNHRCTTSNRENSHFLDNDLNFNKIVKHLNLNDSQEKLALSIEENLIKNINEIENQKIKFRRDLIAEFSNKKIVPEKIYALVDDEIESFRQAAYSLSDSFVSFNNLLTNEQKDTFKSQFLKTHYK